MCSSYTAAFKLPLQLFSSLKKVPLWQALQISSCRHLGRSPRWNIYHVYGEAGNLSRGEAGNLLRGKLSNMSCEAGNLLRGEVGNLPRGEVGNLSHENNGKSHSCEGGKIQRYSVTWRTRYRFTTIELK